jgi:hypothetical protein
MAKRMECSTVVIVSSSTSRGAIHFDADADGQHDALVTAQQGASRRTLLDASRERGGRVATGIC